MNRIAAKLLTSALVSIFVFVLVSGVHGQQRGQVLIVEVEAPIDAGTADLIQRGISAANQPDVRSVIIRLNTNGGYLIATENIVDAIRRSSRPVVVWVGPSGARAFSAGTYIAMAANTIAMAPGTSIGAATPIPSEPKTVKALTAYMKSLAQVHNRNETIAERFVTEALTLTSREALQAKIADFEAADLSALLTKLGLGDSSVTYMAPDVRSGALSLLNDPIITVILFAIGALLIWIDIHHPTIIATAVGAAAVIMALFGLGIIGLDPLVVTLLVIAAATIILELKVGHGILALVGVIIALVAAAIIYQGEPLIKAAYPSVPDYVIATSALAFAGISGAYLWRLRETFKLRKSPLDPSLIIGQSGVVKSAIHPPESGIVLVASDMWTATADNPIEAGASVRVKSIQGLRIHVEPNGANR